MPVAWCTTRVTCVSSSAAAPSGCARSDTHRHDWWRRRECCSRWQRSRSASGSRHASTTCCIVRTQALAGGGATVNFEQQLLREGEAEPLATGQVRVACIEATQFPAATAAGGIAQGDRVMPEQLSIIHLIADASLIVQLVLALLIGGIHRLLGDHPRASASCLRTARARMPTGSSRNSGPAATWAGCIARSRAKGGTTGMEKHLRDGLSRVCAAAPIGRRAGAAARRRAPRDAGRTAEGDRPAGAQSRDAGDGRLDQSLCRVCSARCGAS